MAQQKIPGTVRHTGVITAQRVIEVGPTTPINNALEGARNTLQQLLGPARPGRTVHIIISTVDQVTDAAGAVIETRADPSG